MKYNFFLFLYTHDVPESYYNLLLNPFKQSNFRETLQSQHFPPALNAANSKHFTKLIFFFPLRYGLDFISFVLILHNIYFYQ